MKVTTIGLDVAKQIFQVHGADAEGQVVLRKRLRRSQVAAFFANLLPCVVGLEASGGSHYWSRVLSRFGHTVRLIAPQFVKPYMKSNKNDANDAEAICEAEGRPHMRFVPAKSVERQDIQSLHRVRSRLVGSRKQLANQIRGVLMEYGIVLPQHVGQLRRGLPGILVGMPHKVMFEFDAQLRVGWPAMPSRDERGLPLQSRLDPFIRMWEHRAQCIAEPPSGYSSIVCPKGGVVDRQFMISATFSAQLCDSSDPTQAAWWNSLGRRTQATSLPRSLALLDSLGGSGPLSVHLNPCVSNRTLRHSPIGQKWPWKIQSSAQSAVGTLLCSSAFRPPTARTRVPRPPAKPCLLVENAEN